MRPTHTTIAEAAGVSRLVVSQVLNKSRGARISQSTRQQILEIAEQLNYQPRSITTHAIGCVLKLDHLSIEGEVQILKALQFALSTRGYRLVIAEFDRANPEQFCQAINAKTVDGVILELWHEGKVCDLLPPDVPFVVSAESDGIGDDVDQVTTDAYQASRLMAEHTLAQGHTRITLVSGPLYIKLHRLVKTGFLDALESAGVPISQAQFIETSQTADIAVLLRQQLQAENPPTAIIGLEFICVASVLNQLQSAGYRVPDDISVASIYNSPHYAWLHPSITSTSAGGDTIAPYIVERLLEKIENPGVHPQRLLVPARLLRRTSLVPPKNHAFSASISPSLEEH